MKSNSDVALEMDMLINDLVHKGVMVDYHMLQASDCGARPDKVIHFVNNAQRVIAMGKRVDRAMAELMDMAKFGGAK